MFACVNHIIVSPSLNLPRPGWKTREERVVAVTAQREPPPYSPLAVSSLTCVVCIGLIGSLFKVIWNFVYCDHIV